MFDIFLKAQHESDPRWAPTADKLTEEQANSPGLYERYAFFSGKCRGVGARRGAAGGGDGNRQPARRRPAPGVWPACQQARQQAERVLFGQLDE